MTDTDLVLALLRSYADWEPPIPTIRPQAVRGEAQGRLETCPHCAGEGRIGTPTLKRPEPPACKPCKGRGRVWVDPMTSKPVHATESSYADLVRRKRVRCDVCGGTGQQTRSFPGCPGCAGVGTVETLDSRVADLSIARAYQDWGQRISLDGGDPVADDPDPEFWLSRALTAKARLWATGSYGDLESLLVGWRDSARARDYRLLDRHLIHPIDGALVLPRLEHTLSCLVAELALALPKPIRVPDHALRWNADGKHALWHGRNDRHAEERSARDDQMRAMAVDHPPAVLASTFALSERRVRQIVQYPTSMLGACATGPAC